MTSLFRLIVLPLTLFLTLTVSGCGGGGDTNYVPPQFGTLKLTIVDGSIDPVEVIPGANVLLLNGAGDPVKNYTSDDINGLVIQENLPTGSYQLKISALDYNPSPAPTVPPLPVKILDNYQTTEIIVELFPHADPGNLGTITGSVTDQLGNGIAGALVIAENGGNPVATTITAADGSYVLHNITHNTTPVLTAFIKGYNFAPVPSELVTAGGTTADQNILAISNATGSISGKITFAANAVKNIPVDVTLIDPETREVIPGLRVYSDLNDADNYTMTGIPNGDYEIVASLLNDGDVMDPNLTVNPSPFVTISNSSFIDKDFKVTGEVELDTPATPTNNSVPVLSATPTFEWHRASSYSSAHGYAIEVVDESGTTIWGGFDGSGQPTVTVANAVDVTIDYSAIGKNFKNNSDYPIGSPLEDGRYYQLRIYAFNYVTPDATTYPDGIQTLSVSENLDGVFKVEVLP